MLCIRFILPLDSDHAVGDRLLINDIRQLVKDDPDLQNLSKAQEAELREELTALREEKKRGARPTNRSAAQDYHCHLEWFNDEVSKTIIICSLPLTSASY
jgi:hypothetical protein